MVTNKNLTVTAFKHHIQQDFVELYFFRAWRLSGGDSVRRAVFRENEITENLFFKILIHIMKNSVGRILIFFHML